MLLLKRVINKSKTFLDLLEEKLKTKIEINYSCDKTKHAKFPDNFFAIETIECDFVASFCLAAMPGCCGIVISTNSFIVNKYRNNGIGTILNQMRQKMAFMWNYSLMLCTDIINNEPQQKILFKNGWSKLTDFVNKKTTHKIAIHSIHLDEIKIPLGFKLPTF